MQIILVIKISLEMFYGGWVWTNNFSTFLILALCKYKYYVIILCLILILLE